MSVSLHSVGTGSIGPATASSQAIAKQHGGGGQKGVPEAGRGDLGGGEWNMGGTGLLGEREWWSWPLAGTCGVTLDFPDLYQLNSWRRPKVPHRADWGFT